MDHHLVTQLRRAGKRVETLRLPDGSGLLCLPYGGRVLGLFAPGDARNFYWVNPVLRTAAGARGFLASGRWQNTGGERIWLGPEFDFFFPRHPDLSVYVQPRPLDAGTFRVTRTREGFRLAQSFTVRSHQHRVSFGLRLSRTLAAAPDPLRDLRRSARLRGLQYAGYTQHTRFSVAAGGSGRAVVGLWSLTQLPQGGEMFVPTYGPPRPTRFFGEVPPGDLRLTGSGLRCRMRAGSHLKLGLKATQVAGRVGYSYTAGGVAHLVVRNFAVNPSGDYVDAPWTDTADTGYAVQACNVSDADAGNFSELEYHTPAIGGPTGRRAGGDLAQVWAYRGTRSQVARVADELLGVSLA